MRKALALILMSAWCGAADADAFAKRFNQGAASLQAGDADEAVSVFRDLQVEEPESKEVHYNLGCARYAQGMDNASRQAPDKALEAFEGAKASFQKAANSVHESVSRGVAYNSANTLAQIAKHGAGASKPKEGVAAFEEAVRAYEDVLQRYPDHEKARRNLDHIRYLLKKMLQNPPPPQPNQGGEDGKGEEPPEKSEQDEAGSQPEPEKGASEQPRPQQEPQTEEQSGAPQPDPEAGETSEAASGEGKAKPAGPRDRQNVEALLQSLEDLDNQEQQILRDQGPATELRREWW